MTKHRPTQQAYAELRKAYDFYNQRLFGGRLPRCLITMQRERNTYGYFSPDRWAKVEDSSVADDGIVDEIALNPAHFATRSVEAVMSTLVHEMVHLKQHHFGKPGRGRYHNKEWATMMDDVGLCPSNTGEPGGKRTGDQMTHYIVDGGPFDVATQELMADGFTLSWMDRVVAISRSRGTSGGGSSVVSAVSGGKVTTPAKSSRQKYSCRKCGLNAWAKHDAALTCTECKQQLEAVD